MRLPIEITELIEYISALQAYYLLSKIDSPNITIFLNGQLRSVHEIILGDRYKNVLAKYVGPFVFWGGPPTKLTYYRGTLFTLLQDRIFDCLHHRTEQFGYQYAVEAIKQIICDSIPQCLKVKV